MPAFGRVAIVGVGLIGGSVAATLRARGLAGSITGFSPDAPDARALGLIDEAAGSVAGALDGADFAVLAAPVPAIAALMPQVGAALGAQAVLTDTGSTKGSIVAAARAHLGARLARFVPAHPIAGSEQSGPQAADARLFDGARVIVSPLPETAPDATQRAQDFWAALGGRIETLTPAAHDAVLAAVSHLPHVAAYALALALARRPDADDALRLAGGGLRDTSRIAASPALLWTDILLDNREALAEALGQFESVWAELAAALRAADRAGVAALLDEAGRWRRRL